MHSIKRGERNWGKACSIPLKHIISLPDVSNIYQAPIIMEKEKVSDMLADLLKLNKRGGRKQKNNWRGLVRKMGSEKNTPVDIAIAGKYFKTGENVLTDSYISILEAIKFSGAELNVRPQLHWINAQDFERAGKRKMKEMNQFDAIIIPGGFGTAGVRGKLAIIRHAREHGIPVLGICYGMQLMVVEYMRNKVNKKDAHTTEVDQKTKTPVIDVMEEQKEKLANSQYGGTMRLGGYTMKIRKGSLLEDIYGQRSVTERHRHRYELNNTYIPVLQKEGMYVTAYSKSTLAEVVELDTAEHPFYLGTQFHPELTARPFTPNPIFTQLLRAAKRVKTVAKKKATKQSKKSGP